ELDLGENQIRYEGAIALAEALKRNKTVTKLGLELNMLVVEGAKAIADALKRNTTVTKLDLGYNQIGDKGAKAIAGALERNTTVTELDLIFNQIGVEGTKAIADALRVNKTLTYLKLRSNGIGDEAAKAIADALRVNKTLTELDLRYNEIRDKGAKAIADALEKNTTVTKLDLYANSIADSEILTNIQNLLERNNKIKTIKDSLLKGAKIERIEGDKCSINNTTYDNEVVALAIKDMVKDLEPSDKDSDSERNRKGDVTNDLKNVNKSNNIYALVRTLNSLDDSGKKIFNDTEKNIFIEEFVKSDEVIKSIKSISLTLRSSKQSFLPPETRLNILYHMLPLAIGTIFTDKENNTNIKKLDSFIQIFTPQGKGKMDIGYITHAINRPINDNPDPYGPTPNPTVYPASNAAELKSEGNVRR
ncbi:hypothetical protein N9R48_03280, partial [Rickettsiales bacterium]|nr:hypothetical protein [Rickettsiales bacterium]